MDSIDITFFIPCLNEEENIRATFETLFEALKIFSYSCEIIAVDDGSTDRTWEILKELSERPTPFPVRVIRCGKNRGLGNNYFATAPLARGKYYMTINGDHVEPVSTIRAILSQMGKADMIIPFFGAKDQRTKSRTLLSKIFTKTVNILSGKTILYYNGPALHRTENVAAAGLKVWGFGYQAELICKLLREGKSFLEVPVCNVDRQGGKSKSFHPANVKSVLGSLLRIGWRRRSI